MLIDFFDNFIFGISQRSRGDLLHRVRRIAISHISTRKQALHKAGSRVENCAKRKEAIWRTLELETATSEGKIEYNIFKSFIKSI